MRVFRVNPRYGPQISTLPFLRPLTRWMQPAYPQTALAVANTKKETKEEEEKENYNLNERNKNKTGKRRQKSCQEIKK